MLGKEIKLLHYICCMIGMVCIGEWTFHWMVKDKKRFLMSAIIYAAGFLCLLVEDKDHIPFFMIFYVAEFVSWMLLCKGNMIKRFFKMLAIFYGVGVVEAGISMILEIVIQDRLSKEMLSLLSILLTIGIGAIITKQSWYKKIIESIQILQKYGVILIFLAIVSGVTIVGYGNLMQDMVAFNGLVFVYRIIFTIELLTIMGIIVWVIMESNQKKYYLEQNELKEEIVRTQQEYYRMLYDKDKEMRSFRHDIASQLGMLQILLKREDFANVEQHLENICKEFQNASFQKIYVGNEMLDAVLSMMNQKAKEKNLQLVVEGKLEHTKNYNVYELCHIFSNAIMNGLEACEKVKNENAAVYVKLLEQGTTLLCVVENPATEEMYQHILQGETSKEDVAHHGYGVGNIQRSVKRLNGEYKYTYKNGKVILEILLSD